MDYNILRALDKHWKNLCWIVQQREQVISNEKVSSWKSSYESTQTINILLCNQLNPRVPRYSLSLIHVNRSTNFLSKQYLPKLYDRIHRKTWRSSRFQILVTIPFERAWYASFAADWCALRAVASENSSLRDSASSIFPETCKRQAWIRCHDNSMSNLNPIQQNHQLSTLERTTWDLFDREEENMY